jgi:TPR repeat protein
MMISDVLHRSRMLTSAPRKTECGRGRPCGARGWAVLATILTCCCLIAGPVAAAERRVALVIGNAAYQNVDPLKTPTTDAARVADLLRTLDFSVMELTDVDKIAMEQALRHFSAEINGADVALFYFSGHGVQVGNLNYLVPTSAKVNSARSLPLDTIALQDVSAAMRHAGAKIQLLFLDACRNNPFANAFAARQADEAASGFAPVETATGSLIVFSTSPGKVALDGTGDVSPFTSGFLQFAAIPNLDIRQVLSRVRSYVAARTNDLQVPWDNSSLLGDFYLVPKRPPPIFERLSQIEIASDIGEQALRLPPPIQPEGGKIVVKIEKAPSYGRLLLASHQIQDDDLLSPADFARIAYRSASPQLADTFSYRVSDAWGNTDVGLVSITRKPGQRAVVDASNAPTNNQASENISASAISLVGLSPNLVFRKPLVLPIEDNRRRVQLASALPFGQIELGERVIEKGRTLLLSDLAHLTFDAPVGSEGSHLEALFTAAEDSPGEVRIKIDLQLTDCDRLAGDRLDAQGVSKGVLPSQIDTGAALPACEIAVKAQPNSGRFKYQLGRVYAALGRDGDALTAYRKAVDLGHVRAQWALGYHDLYVPPGDPARGKETLERAAAAGDVYSIHTLGQVYYEGRGVPKDLEKARSLYETAARMGHTFSMNALGRMYQRGETVSVNPVLARRYWEESAARGDIYGMDNLGFVYLEGVDVEKDPAKALLYFKQASDLGHPEAPNNIGRLYVLGTGVPVDYAEARRWYLLGADRGDAWAAYNLGELYRLGKGGPADDIHAGYYYARAAGSINRVEPAELARKQLASLDQNKKPRILRLLLHDLDPANDRAPDESLSDIARRTMAARNVQPTNTSTDATLIGTAQTMWLARSVRSDLF